MILAKVEENCDRENVVEKSYEIWVMEETMKGRRVKLVGATDRSPSAREIHVQLENLKKKPNMNGSR